MLLTFYVSTPHVKLPKGAGVNLAKACGTQMLLQQDSACVDVQRETGFCDRYQQMGNAVSPCVASALGRCLALAAAGAVAPDLDHAVVPVPDPQLIKVVTLSSRCAAFKPMLCLMYAKLLSSMQADLCDRMTSPPAPPPPPQGSWTPQIHSSPVYTLLFSLQTQCVITLL